MSHGTIGFLTAVTIPILPAPKYEFESIHSITFEFFFILNLFHCRYVKVEYIPTKSLETVQELLCSPGYDFVEGITFDLNSTVVMLGTKTNTAESSKV